MNTNKRYSILSPITGTRNIVSANSMEHAIQKVVELDNYVLSNVEYFKVNGKKEKVKINVNTTYKLN